MMRALKSLSAALILICLVIGLPIALWVFAGSPIPTEIPSWPEIQSALTHPDSGGFVLGIIKVVAWVAWASFALSAVVELRNYVSGGVRISLPGLGWQQSAAAALIAAVFMGAGAPAMAASPAPQQAVAASVSTAIASEKSDADLDDAPGQEALAYTVQSGDSLWRIAERTLGDGQRWQEIADLNYGVPQADGHSLTGEHWLNAGWVLTLPATAHTTSAPQSEVAPGQVVVAHGQTLEEIAADHLGDGSRWPEIFEASKVTVQSDGRTLTDPDLLRPGWVLTLPASAQAAPSIDAGLETTGDVEDAEASTQEVPLDSADAVGAAQGSTDSAVSASSEQSVDPAVAAEVDRAARAAQQDAHVQDGEDDLEEVLPAGLLRTAGGLTLLSAASILGVLGVRRRRARRTHPNVTPFPARDSQESLLEAQLNAVADTATLDHLDHALRDLTVWHRSNAAPLPELAFARLEGSHLQLFLTDAASLPAPWVDMHERSVWELDVSALNGSAPDITAPWPALVVLGNDEEGGQILVDLERAPSLDLRGAEPDAHSSLRAVASTLALSPWGEDLQLTLVSTMSDFVDAMAVDRVRFVTGIEEVISELEQRADEVSEALTEDKASSPLEARGRGTAIESWHPEILILPDDVDDESRDRLDALLARIPRVGVASVTRAGTRAPWSLTLTRNAQDAPEAVLEPAGIKITPQLLSEDEYASVIELLAPPQLQDTNAQPASTTEKSSPVPALYEVPFTESAADVVQLPQRSATAARITTQDLTTPPDLTSLTDRPTLGVLGPVTLSAERGAPSKQTSVHAILLDVMVFLKLHGPASMSQLAAAIWPMKKEQRDDRIHQTISRARSWLGADTNEEPFIPRAKSGEDYRIEGVVTDYELMRELIGPCMQDTDTEDLVTAMRLVRGRPIGQTLNPDGTVKVRSQRFAWAESYRADMIPTILDLAHEIATRALEASDHKTAEWAARSALQLDEGDERLWRDLLTAIWLTGDDQNLEDTIDATVEAIDQLEIDLESQTTELIAALRSQTPLAVG